MNRLRAVLAIAVFAAVPVRVSGQARALRFGTLVDGTGRTIRDAVVVVEGERIVSVGTGDAAVPAGADVIDLRRYTGIPGMIDAHTHMTYYWDGAAGTSPWRAGAGRTPEQTVDVSVANARHTLGTGVTTVRDLGASNYTDILLRDRIARGDVVGPRMIVAGYGLQRARSGTAPPAAGSPDPVQRGRVAGLADVGPAVEAQVSAGADVIKMYGSTGSGADVTGRQTFTFEEMKAAVEAAHRLGRRIAIHSYGPEGGHDAVFAGAESLEHSIDLDDETIAEMVRRGTVYVPTIDHNRYYSEYREDFGYSPDQAAALDSFRAHNLATARRAVRAGVKFAMGSDAVFTMFGQNTRELEWFVEAGMTPAQALATATMNGAELLGLQQDIGTVTPGKFADIVAVEGDPLQDIHVIINGVRWVMKGGAIVVDRTR